MGKFFEDTTEEESSETFNHIIEASYKLPFLIIKKLDDHLKNNMDVKEEKKRHDAIKEMIPLCLSAHHTILTANKMNDIDKTIIALLEVTDVIKEELNGINESLRALVLFKDIENKNS